MINKEGLIKAPKHPRRALLEVYGQILNLLLDGNGGEYVLDRDWDNLIILDACRYDLFEKCNFIDGDLSIFHSRGTDTGEFLDQNFGGESHPSIVYVTAKYNPYPNDNDTEFSAVEEVWKTDWDETLHTVPPESMVRRTLEAQDRYPNKRLISHFLQPHYPWIGEKGRKFLRKYGYTPGHQDDNVWMQLREGKICADRLWNVYKENLEITLPHVKDLAEELVGKTVITSDHGNAFGEMGVYGHPTNVYIPPLVRVPWLELPYNERKEIDTKGDIQSVNLKR